MEKNFKISLGCGLACYTYNFIAGCIDEALELLTKQLIEEESTALYMDPDEFYNEYPDVEDESEVDYLYIDGTMSGAPHPVYIPTSQMYIEEF